MKGALRLLGGAALLLACGCDIRFTEPVRDLPARLTVAVNLSDGGSELLRLNARLTPGTDGEGVPRPIQDDTLRVMGTALGPAQIQRNGVRLYSKNTDLTAEFELGELMLGAPMIRHDGTPPPTLPFGMRRRLGADSLDLRDGETLEFPISPLAPGLGASSTQASWELQVRPAGSGNVIFTIRSPTTPPAVIRIPVGLVAEEPTPDLAARLRITERWDWEAPSRDYAIELEAVSVLRWTLRWEQVESEEPPVPDEPPAEDPEAA